MYLEFTLIKQLDQHMTREYIQNVGKIRKKTKFVKHLLMAASERHMILILFFKVGKFEPDDSYKLNCSKKMCVSGGKKC